MRLGRKDRTTWLIGQISQGVRQASFRHHVLSDVGLLKSRAAASLLRFPPGGVPIHSSAVRLHFR